KKNLDPSFELFSDILLHPTFPDEEIERVRNDRLTHLRQQKDTAAVIASKVFNGAVYGSGHPYGFMEIGTEDSNRDIDRKAIVQFYRSGYTPGNSALVVSGDIEASEIHSLAEKYLGSLKNVPSGSTPEAITRKTSPRLILVDRPESSQTVLRIGHTGLPHSHPDYVPVDVMNTILGGLFSSRMNRNLRERNGYTYGVSSSYLFRRGPGPFVIGTSVRADATAAAIREIFNEIKMMQSERVTREELSIAKDSIARSLPGLFETTYDTASSLGHLFVYDLPDTFYRDLPDRIQQVSREDVQKMAGEHLKPNEAVVVAVGDRKKIEKSLKEIDFGTIELRDSGGEPI
ncbi:MAG: pitrilysin family protein, partial [Acidobacteriota bacterium]